MSFRKTDVIAPLQESGKELRNATQPAGPGGQKELALF